MSLDLERAKRLERRFTPPPPAQRRSNVLLGQVTTTTATIAVGKFLAFHPVTILGSEVEGGAATLAVNTNATRYGVLIQGTAAQGDILAFKAASWRWAAAGDGIQNCDAGARICAQITNNGCGVSLGTGATITVIDELTGDTVSTCTTTGQVLSVSLYNNGSGYTDGTGYALSFLDGGGSGASGTFDVVGGQITNIQITDGGSGYTSAPSPDFSAAGEGSSPTASVLMAEQCCITISHSGLYTVQCSFPGATVKNVSTFANCDETDIVEISYATQPTTVASISGFVGPGCGGINGIPGTTVTGTQASGASASTTTDSTGHYSFGRVFEGGEAIDFTATPPAPWPVKTWSVTYGTDATTVCSGVTNNDVTYNGRSCPDVAAGDLPDDYICDPAGLCTEPVHGTSFTLNDPAGATVTMAYEGCDATNGVSWIGTAVLSIPAYSITCSDGLVLNYGATSVTVTYRLWTQIGGLSGCNKFHLDISFSNRTLVGHCTGTGAVPDPRFQPSDDTGAVNADGLGYSPGSGGNICNTPTLVSCPPAYSLAFPIAADPQTSSMLGESRTITLTL